MSKPTTEASDKFIVRLPAGMREAIKTIASDNERTMNGEIVFRLKKSLEAEKEAT